MLPALQRSVLELDELAEAINRSSSTPESLQNLKGAIYMQFLYELQKKAKQSGEISPKTIKRIKKLLKPVNSHVKFSIRRQKINRGRPVKDEQAELKLAQWIRSQGRTRFTKKQLQAQYASYLSRKKRSPTIKGILRMLDRCSIRNLQILTKQVGKSNACELPDSGEDMREISMELSAVKIEQKQSSPRVECKIQVVYDYEFVSEPNQYFSMPDEDHEKLLDSILCKVLQEQS